MKNRLIGLLLVVLLGLALFACSREPWRIPMALPRPDSTAQPIVFGAGKYKFTGPVTFTVQQGQGNTATSAATDNRKAGQKRGTAATGADSTAASEQGGTPWYVFAGIAVVAALLGIWACGKLPRLSNFLNR